MLHHSHVFKLFSATMKTRDLFKKQKGVMLTYYITLEVGALMQASNSTRPDNPQQMLPEILPISVLSNLETEVPSHYLYFAT